jgi:hypothetical protein
VLMVPVVVRGVVVALLYADGGPKGETIGQMTVLKAMLDKVGTALAAEHDSRNRIAAVG